MVDKVTDKQLEQLEGELERYLKSYSHDPKSRTFAPLGETYRKMGKLDEAVGILEEGIKVHPNYASGHISLGRCFSDKGEAKKAVQEFEIAIKLAPDNIMAYRLIAGEYKKLNDEASLGNIYMKLLILLPSDQEALNFLNAKGLLKQKEPLKRETKVKPDSFAGKRPSLLQENPKVEEKVAGDIKKDFPPSVAQTVAPARTKEPESASVKPQSIKVEGISEAISKEERKTLEFYTVTLAEIYLKQGLKDEAREIYEVLLRNNPTNKIYVDALTGLKGVTVIRKEAPKEKPQLKEDVRVTADSKLLKLNTILNLIRLRKRKA